MEPESSSPPLQDPPPNPILSQINPVRALPHPTSWRSFLILSYHLRLGLPSILFPSGVPTKTLDSPILNYSYCHITRLNNVQSWPLYQKFVANVQPDRKIHINFNFVLGSDATWIGFLPTFKRKMMFLSSRSKYVGWLRVKQVLRPLISALYHIIGDITSCIFPVISYRQTRSDDTRNSTDLPGELKDFIFSSYVWAISLLSPQKLTIEERGRPRTHERTGTV
jgi:hypothetical protein